MKNFIFLTRDFHILPCADRLKDDGKNVVVGMIEEEDKKGVPKERHDARLALYDNILEKFDADDVLKWMKGIKDKDEWWVHVDYGDQFKYAEAALEMGFTKGILPTEEDYSLESDRQKGKDYVKKHYPDVHVAEVHEFKKVDDAIKFLEEQKDKIFVLKSEGSFAETVVPETDDVELARRQVVGAMLTEKSDYEKGFTLEEKIRHPIELSPVALFWNGKLLCMLLELENKPIGCGNIGRLTGGAQNLTIQMRPDCQLAKIAFPPVVFEAAKNKPGLSVYDAGLLFDGKNFNFGEFAGMRFGFDGFYSTLAMCGDEHGHGCAVNFFDKVAAGQNPLLHKYAAAVRLFQTQPGDGHGTFEAGYFLDWRNEVSDQLFLYCIEGKELPDGKMGFVSNCLEKEIGVATGTADNQREAVKRAYDCARGVAMVGLYYRCESDLVSKDYVESIWNRLDFLGQSGLL